MNSITLDRRISKSVPVFVYPSICGGGRDESMISVRSGWFGLVVLLASCSILPALTYLTEDDAKLLRDSTLYVITFQKSDFQFGSRGTNWDPTGTAARNVGNALIARYGLSDPALQTADRLARALTARYGIREVKVHPEPFPVRTDFVVALKETHVAAAAAGNQGIVLEVRTYWSLSEDGPAPGVYNGHYQLRTIIGTRLIDGKSGKLLQYQSCSRVPKDNLPTYEELVGDNAALLKKKLSDAAVFCANLFMNEKAAGAS